MGLRKPPGRRKQAPRPRRRLHDGALLRADIVEIYRLFQERAEFMDAMRRDIDTQFKRIAQIQAELDRIKRARDRTDED